MNGFWKGNVGCVFICTCSEYCQDSKDKHTLKNALLIGQTLLNNKIKIKKEAFRTTSSSRLVNVRL